MSLRISIITPCRNGVRHIGEALESLGRQGCGELEHLVMDAGSTDGTLDVVARFPDSILVKEPDNGAHDAMNKGIARSTGDVIGFLNSDDVYEDGTLARVAQLFEDDPTLDMVVGGSVVFKRAESSDWNPIVARDHIKCQGLWPPELTFGAPGLNGRFARRRVFDGVGGFDDSYFYGADRKFLISVALARFKSRPLGRTAIWYRSHDRSFTFNQAQRNAAFFALENLRMAREFLSRAALADEWRRLLHAWHAFEALRLMWRAPGRIDVGRVTSALAQAWWFDPLWLRYLPEAFRYRADVIASERRYSADSPLPR